MATARAQDRVYYPICAVSLQVRLEEFAGDLPREALDALGGAVGRFRWIPDGSKWEHPSEQDGPLVAAARRLTFEVVTIPTSLTVRHNSYRAADECDVTIPWELLPLDMRAVRSLGVVAYMGTLDASRWAEAMGAGVAPSQQALAEAWAAGRVSVTSIEDLIQPEHIRFCGFADEPEETHESEGGSLSFGARDWTGILIDTQVPTAVYRDIAASGGWDRPIEVLMLEILASLPAMHDVPLHLVGIEPGAVRAIRGSAHRAGGAGKGASRAPRVAGETYWDLMTDLAVTNGCVIYSDVWPAPPGQTPARFVLTRPTNIYSNEGPRPYVVYQVGRPGIVARGTEPNFASKGRAHPGDSSEVLTAPAMVYGWNLERLSFRRRLAREQVPSVRVVAMDGKRKISARYPESGRRGARVAPSGLWASDEERIIPVSGVTSEADLREIARQTFEMLGRGEMEMEFRTSDLASFGGDNSDPDMLHLRVGHPVEVLFAQEVSDGSDGEGGHGTTYGLQQRLLAMTEAELRAYLEDVRGLDSEAASVLAARLKDPRVRELLCRQWYVREVEHTVDAEGYACSCRGVNYVQARVEADARRSEGVGNAGA